MDILAHLSSPQRAHLFDCSRTVTLSRGELLYLAGDRGQAIYLVSGGLVRRYLLTTEGRQVVTDLARQGDLLGEAAVYGGQHNTFAEAVVESELCAIPAWAFRESMADTPELALWVTRTIARRIRAAERLSEALSRRAASARMAALLLDLQEPGNSAVAGFSHQDLGDMIGVYRETATIILNAFRRRGLVATRPKHIEILKPQALRALANEPRRRSILTRLAVPA